MPDQPLARNLLLPETMNKPETGTVHPPQQYHDLVQVICRNMPEVIAIYLFGSQSSGTQHAGSDIDLAILATRQLPDTEVWNLAQILASKLSRDVDLVDLKQASTVLRMQVISKGQRLHCSDEQSCEMFEDFVFSDYARLNEERSGILESIEKRGTVYG